MNWQLLPTFSFLSARQSERRFSSGGFYMNILSTSSAVKNSFYRSAVQSKQDVVFIFLLIFTFHPLRDGVHRRVSRMLRRRNRELFCLQSSMEVEMIHCSLFSVSILCTWYSLSSKVHVFCVCETVG